jgi:hypothetical protein
MKDRLIVVPTSKEAEQRLDYNKCTDNDLIEYNLNEVEFDELYDIGFFAELNDKLGLMIDDYESEEILEDKLKNLEDVMECYLGENPRNILLSNLNNLFQVAYEKRTGVFFFF